MKSPDRGLPTRLAIAVPLAVLAACGTAAIAPAATQPAARTVSARPVAVVAARPLPARANAKVTVTARGTKVPGAPNCTMFPADNIWNTDISKLPVNRHSAAWLRSMDSASTNLHPDFGPNSGGFPFGIPYTIVSNAHPLVHIKFQYAGESNKGPYPFGPGTQIEGGKHAGGDRHAIMVNKNTCTLYELWHARYSAKGSTAGSGAIWHLTSNKLRHAGWTSADAAGLPILPGLLNYNQVRAAVKSGKPITHAIRFTAQQTQSAFVWPARHQAGSGSNPNLPPMGARFRLKDRKSVV